MTIMAFGIPGDAVTAVMLGALTIHGIQPGPLFISQHQTLAYGIFAAYIVSHFLMILIMLVGVRWFIRVITVPKAILFPIILVLCVIGAYALSNTMANVYVLLLFGVIGYAEINLIRAIMTDSNPWLFLTRPISGGLLVLSVASVTFALWQHRRHQKRNPQSAEDNADF